MRLSLGIATVLVLLFSLMGWRNHSHLAEARETRVKLEQEATRLGIPIDPAERVRSRSSRRERVDREGSARILAADLISFAKEMELLEKAGKKPDEAMQVRILDFMERVASLDIERIKNLIAEVRAQPDLAEETRQGMVGFVVMMLCNDHPGTAMELLVTSRDLFENNPMGNFLVPMALPKWAGSDPQAAIAWVRDHEAEFPELIDEQVKEGLLAGIAASDPKLAFQLIKELGLDPSDPSPIANAATTPAEMTTTLAALREYLAGAPASDDPERILSNVMHNFASRIAREGFMTSTTWILSTNPTSGELEGFAEALPGSVKSEETGQWIQWVQETLPQEKSTGTIGDMVRMWATEDYKAAAEWLNAAPEGPARTAAIRSYAETVAPYEPESAAQWALALPAGKARDETLKSIHRKWPESDPEGAAAFAGAHGIK